jgi:hypothetical protein
VGNTAATCNNKFLEKVPFQEIYYEPALRAYFKNRTVYLATRNTKH